MKHKFDFLLLEFKDIYYTINKIWEEEDLRVINLKLIKLIKEIIITAHLNNKIFYNTENNLDQNMEILYEKNIISYDLMRYIKNYLEELEYFKTLLSGEIDNEKKFDYKELLKNEDLIYELCVWLAIKCGEEDYSLCTSNLGIEEKNMFNKYINLNLDNNYDNDLLESFELDEINEMDDIDDIDEFLDKEETSAEENLLAGELYYLGKNVDKDYYKAKEYFEKAAKEGNEHGESYLGLFFEKGYGGEKDMDKALYWYKKAALKGNVFSQYSLGYLYYEGEKVEKNLDYAFKWYKEAAEKGFAPAQYALSYLYRNGEGCEQSIFKAYYWLEESADNNFEDGYYILGQSYLEGNSIDTDYKKAFFYLSKGVSNNDINCLESLGDMYYWGLHVNVDKEKAFSLYDKSIEEGNIGLYYKVGKLYEAEDDMENALINYYKGHSNGDIKSTQRLGIMYLNGEGVNVNKEKALRYINLGVEQGEPHSLYIMGITLLYEDKEEALKYLLEAYRKGSYQAAEVLAGEGIKDYLNYKEINELDILGYVNTAVEKGRALGIYYYGLLNHYGIGVEKSDEMAFINFKEAAEKGCEEAILQIANWYKNGIFLSKDIEDSISWYEKAVEMISIRGINELIDIYEKGIGGRKDHLKAFEGAELLRKLDIVQGNKKLAYYYLKGIGTEASVNKANKCINELMTLDEGKGYNLLGELCEEGLLDAEKEEAIGYYLKAISLGELDGYSNLEYYLYKNDREIKDFKIKESDKLMENPKSIYVKSKKEIEKGIETQNKSLINRGIELLMKSIYLGLYEGINDLIKMYEKDESIEGKIKLYKYKEMKIHYNVM